ncbi:MAG: hypothetical protein IJ062_03005 [Firmicutes bacterium]|nr:hypothetical protein [Bacillota bacterium]
MKKYTKPVAEIEVFDSTDIITLSGVNLMSMDDIDDDYTAEALGLNK